MDSFRRYFGPANVVGLLRATSEDFEMNIEHRTTPIEHWIVDRKAYRLATADDIGKEVIVDTSGIRGAMGWPAKGTLVALCDGHFVTTKARWKYAYIQDDSLLAPQRTPVPALGDGWYLLTAEDGEIQPGDKIRAGYTSASVWIDLPEGHVWQIGSWVSKGHFAARYFGPVSTVLIQPQPKDTHDTPKPIDWTKPVRTKDGRAVRVLCTDGPGDYPVVGFIDENSVPQTWTLGGCFSIKEPGDLDLENAPQRIQREYWVNIYPKGTGGLYETKQGVDRLAGSDRIACVKITIDCEEGEGL